MSKRKSDEDLDPVAPQPPSIARPARLPAMSSRRFMGAVSTPLRSKRPVTTLSGDTIDDSPQQRSPQRRIPNEDERMMEGESAVPYSPRRGNSSKPFSPVGFRDSVSAHARLQKGKHGEDGEEGSGVPGEEGEMSIVSESYDVMIQKEEREIEAAFKEMESGPTKTRLRGQYDSLKELAVDMPAHLVEKKLHEMLEMLQKELVDQQKRAKEREELLQQQNSRAKRRLRGYMTFLQSWTLLHALFVAFLAKYPDITKNCSQAFCTDFRDYFHGFWYVAYFALTAIYLLLCMTFRSSEKRSTLLASFIVGIASVIAHLAFYLLILFAWDGSGSFGDDLTLYVLYLLEWIVNLIGVVIVLLVVGCWKRAHNAVVAFEKSETA
eukprot:TRINITY_DN10345_c0_g3_i1.p1 TRINITY_DN10345_c0_g3~~TRINITY_DN10345_c0_g3_i1.p1  ORF type:complete len:379 (+),score=93.32 TRINITY_DN10345_c0_g3_i1:98-1234(+)